MSNYWADRLANETWERYNNYEEQNKNLLEFYREAIYDIESEVHRLMLKLGDKPSRSDMYDKNRLEKLKKKLEGIVKELGSNTLEHGNKLIQQAIKEQYEEVTTTISNEDFALPNKKEMEMMMNNPWSGMNFSERVWENNRILASNLNEILTRGIIQGKSFSDMAKELDDRMMKGFKRAHALVRTETMHYMNESSKKAYKDVGVNELEVYAAEDERTCEVCGAEHEKTYPMDQAPILPFHPNCRCTYLPVIGKAKTEDDKATWEKHKYNSNQYTDKKSIAKYLDSKYGIKFSESKKYPIDKDILQDCVNWLDKFNDYFPGFDSMNPVKLPAFKIKGNMKAVGHYSYYTNKTDVVELALNGLYFNDKKFNIDYVNKCIKSGWTVPNAKRYKTFVHEYGHHVSNSLKWLDKNNHAYMGWDWTRDFIEDTIKEYNTQYNKKISFKDLSTVVSRYGGTQHGEAFAETFAEYFGGENPREFAVVFGKRIEDKINGYINNGVI